MISWKKCPDYVLDIARKIIREHHPDLLQFNIGFLFRSEASKKGGKKVLGQASKVTGKVTPFLDDLDAIIWLAEDEWHNLDINQRKALVDHELCHFIVVDEELKLIGHDVEEFREIIERYGLWNVDLVNVAPYINQASHQIQLPGFGAPRQGEVFALDPETVESLSADGWT